MKFASTWIVSVCLILALTLPVAADPAVEIGAPLPAHGDRSPGAAVAESVAAVTGIAISPLLATAAYGAYQYYQTPPSARDRLPWFAQFAFWCPALVIVGLVAAKDSLGAVLPPGWKQPLDVLETVENKLSGIIAAGAVIPVTMLTLLQPAEPAVIDGASFPQSGLAMIAQVGDATALHWATVPFALAIYFVVWMASHAINVLILMSPWGGIDAVLKLARLGVLALVGVTVWINPWLGAAFSLVVIVVAYFVAGWAFRLTVYGTLFAWDFLTRCSGRFEVKGDGDLVFATGRLAGLAPRTLGRLKRTEGGVAFVFRRWWRGAERQIPLPANRDLFVGRGMFFANLQTSDGPVLWLLPRYETHEEELARAYGFAGVRDAGLRKVWSWLREAMGVGASTPQRV